MADDKNKDRKKELAKVNKSSRRPYKLHQGERPKSGSNGKAPKK